MTSDIAVVQTRLNAVLRKSGPLAIAVSGGVDSMTLAFIAHNAGLGFRMIHALSPAVPDEATARVRAYAERYGWDLSLTDAGEFGDPHYVANPVNRCFYCKSNLYNRISGLVPMGIASGANLDDLGDYRPGLEAAAKQGVLHPLIEARIDKATVRQLASFNHLTDLVELPAQPCLSSRIETGISIDKTDLAFVNAVERSVRERLPALENVRCRITALGVALELEPFDDIYSSQANEVAGRIAHEHGRTIGTTKPYRRGSAFRTDKIV